MLGKLTALIILMKDTKTSRFHTDQRRFDYTTPSSCILASS